MTKLRDWLFSIPLLVGFGLIMGLGEIAGRITLLFGIEPYERAMASLQAALISLFRIAGVSVEIEGRDGLKESGGYIFVSNHQSMFDIPIFGGILRSHLPRFVAKKSLAKGIPTVSLYLKRGGNALIDRGDRDQALVEIARMGAMCEERDVGAVIFPEGTRSRDGSLGDRGNWKVSGLAALMDSAPSLPIVPTVIDGSWIVFKHNMMPVPYGTDVRVRFGAPIERHADEDPAEILERCRVFAQATLDEWHHDAGGPA
ncbi:MAG: lysophospholipid acyltransferase family protein [Acidimicrobiia bacterium]|nr:lysophospholipid acyltransferase family protein [Acidimicrobiia bacterium]